MVHVRFGKLQNKPLVKEFINKREQHRRRVLKSGSIIFNNSYTKFDCIVRNLNKKGALLAMSDTTGLPCEFELKIGDEAVARNAIVIWRKDTQFGVCFC